jgi:hypothetical protein
MNYPSLISTLEELLQSARTSAAHAVNRHHIPRNWLIGSCIVEFTGLGEQTRYLEKDLEMALSDLMRIFKTPGGCHPKGPSEVLLPQVQPTTLPPATGHGQRARFVLASRKASHK